MYGDRAKQFIPFAALRGYDGYIRQKEYSPEPRRELSEDEAEILSRKMSRAKCGQLLKVTHYANGKYITTEGMTADVDEENRTITLVKTVIRFDDITDISGDGVDDIDEE